MAIVNVGESDFDAVATAANSAHKRGAWKDAGALDKLARKINAALSNSRGSGRANALHVPGVKPLTWQDVESTIPSMARRPAPVPPR